MNEDTDDELYELYTRFKQELNDGNFNEFYDVDDLIDIFDKATDYNDDYVRMEVLLRGQQYHPGNEELRVRRGFLYLDLEIDEGARSVTASTAGRHPLRTILKLRTQVNSLSPQDAKIKLERLIDFTEVIDPETAAQLIECVRLYGLVDWLKKAMPRLRQKVDDLQDLLAQSAILFNNAADYKTAIKLTEDLIELAPFEIEHWQNLAYYYAMEMQPEHVLSVIEYALAIDPMDLCSLAYKGGALADLNRNGEVEQLLAPHAGRLIESGDPYYTVLTNALFSLGHKERAFDILKTRAIRFPDEFMPVRYLLANQAPDVSDIVHRHFIIKGRSDTDQWINTANEFYNEGNYYAALEMFAAMERESLLPLSEHGFYASALYLMGRYLDCARLLCVYLGDSAKELTLDICAAGLLSMCRLRRFDEAKVTVEALKMHYPFELETQWRIGTNLARLGISYLINVVEDQLCDPEHFDIQAVDFFMPSDKPNNDSI